jgi:hypothetical protein
MESCSNPKSVKQIKMYLTFFKVAVLCLGYSFAHSWHSLNQLHDVVTGNAFQLTGVPLFLLNVFEPISCDKVGVVYRRWPYLVKYQVHIMARTAQIS